MIESNLQTMHISYQDKVLRVAFKEKAVIDQKDVLELIEQAKKMVRQEEYVLLVDGRTEHVLVQSAQDMLRIHANPNRKALAILTNNPITEQRVEKYIQNVNQPVTTRQFQDEHEALTWLKGFL